MAGGYDAAAASAEQKALALSAVGVAVIEVAKGSDGTWSVKAGSKYNKRHTGNDTYRVGGPASGILPSTIKGTLNNRSEEHTSELQSLMRISYAVFCLKNKNK